MIIPMSRPWRHPDKGVFYFRSRLPADLKEAVAGRSLTVDVAALIPSVCTHRATFLAAILGWGWGFWHLDGVAWGRRTEDLASGEPRTR